MRINETCSCGGSIEVVATKYASDALKAVDGWRKGHAHEFPPTVSTNEDIGPMSTNEDSK